MQSISVNQQDSQKTVRSSDGTPIAFDRTGEGPPLILVGGAFNDRSAGVPGLAVLLEPHFTVLAYDRRGRGASGDTLPYAVDREIEDLEALIVEAGGSAVVFGMSSGAVLALEAAARGLPITGLALFEPPFGVDNSDPRPSVDHLARLEELIAAGRRGDAVEYFQTQMVGMPVAVAVQMRNAPFRPALEAMAHTLVYDLTIVGDGALPTERLASVVVPALVIGSTGSPQRLQDAVQAVAAALPAGHAQFVAGQFHSPAPEALAFVIAESFAGSELP